MPNSSELADLRLAIGVLHIEVTAAIRALGGDIGAAKASADRGEVSIRDLTGKVNDLAQDLARIGGQIEGPPSRPSSLETIPKILVPIGKLPRFALVGLVAVLIVALFMSPVVALVVFEHARIVDHLLGATHG